PLVLNATGLATLGAGPARFPCWLFGAVGGSLAAACCGGPRDSFAWVPNGSQATISMTSNSTRRGTGKRFIVHLQGRVVGEGLARCQGHKLIVMRNQNKNEGKCGSRAIKGTVRGAPKR